MNDVLKPQVIRASAGTGKTTRLTARYLALLLRGERVERILATTFTRKAAFEIQERVITRLVDAAIHPAECHSLAEATALPNLNQQHVRTVLRYVLSNIHRFQICTLDSFIAQIVGAYAFELGLPGSWRIENESALTDIHQQALAQVCATVEPQLLRGLVEVLARDRARRGVAFVLEQSLNLLGDVYLESGDEAWNWALGRGQYYSDELVTRRIEELEALDLPKTKSQGTVPKNWTNAIARLITALQERNHVAVLENSLLQKVVQGEVKFDRQEISPSVVGVLDGIASEASRVAIQKLSDRTRTLHSLLGVYTRSLSTLKAAQAVYSFTDLKRLFENAELASVLDDIYFRIDSHISHVLLDEFQDTSRHEWRVIEPIAGEVLSKASGETSFFCVGDVKQAIYGWRGGVSEIFERLENKWSQLVPESLDVSYRCSQVLLDFVNSVFAYAPESSVLSAYPSIAEQWRQQFAAHTAGKEQPGYVSVQTAESADVLDGIKALLHDVKTLLGAAASPSIGILVRTNSQVASVVQFLQREFPEVSISQEGGVPFTSYPIVNVLASYFELLDCPGDTVCWQHIRNTPLIRMFGFELAESGEARSRVLRMIRRRLLALGYSIFTGQLLVQLNHSASAEEKRHLHKVRMLVRSFRPKNPLRPAIFAKWLREQKDDDSKQAQLRVMTVHQSKGLEFDAVFLPALDSELKGRDSSVADVLRINPLEPPVAVCLRTNKFERAVIPELQQAEAYERTRRVTEALSLLYVAFTRARHALYISTPNDSSVKPGTHGALILECLATGQCVKESGEQHWFQSQSKQEYEQSATLRVPEDIRFNDCTGSRLRIEHKTASGQESRFHSVKAILDMYRGGIARGIRVHEALQKICWLNDSTIHSILSGQDVSEETIAEIEEFLSDPDIAALFDSREYKSDLVARVAVMPEKQFAFIDGTAVYRGAIDRLVLSFDANNNVIAADIIDFKTDVIKNAGVLEERIQLYTPQMAVYKKSISAMFDCSAEVISARLLFLSSKQLVKVQE